MGSDLDLGTLVPERQCGDCTICCIVPGMDTPAAQKKHSTRCRHCANGCAIYEQRPQACAEFYCAWRRLPSLGDAWRPDRSGVFATLDPVDPESSTRIITLMLIADPHATVRAPWFVDFVIAHAWRRVPLSLALPGPPGCLPIRVVLPEAALQAVVWDGPARVTALLEQAVHFMRAQAPRVHRHAYAGNDMSG